MLTFKSTVSGLRSRLFAIAAASLLTLVACGGGGDGTSSMSSGMSGANPAPSAAGTGKVAIMLTDAPTDAFCQILATVQSMELIGPSGPTSVFSGPVTIDLLKLRNYTDFFSIKTDVPIGTYTKLRLTLSDLALVQCDSAGKPEASSGWEHPHLPGNGKLDLNPRSQFDVIGGETLVIRLDMDMQKSLFLHQTGNGKWQFRPVIFCGGFKPAQDKLVRVFGAASNVNGTQFQLCPLRPAATMVSMSGGSTTPSTECLDVFTDGSTGIFDKDGKPVGLDTVANGDLLTAIGFLSLSGTQQPQPTPHASSAAGSDMDEEDGDDDLDENDNDDGHSRIAHLRLDAAVLELGNSGTFKRFVGRVVSTPGSNDLFVFDPTLSATPQSTTTGIDVRLQSGTRIFALGSNAELTSAALQPGTVGQVDGVFTVPATSGEPLNSSLIVLLQDATPEVVLLGGVIQSPIPADDDTVPATRRLTVVNSANPSGKCVKTDAGTRYLLVTETSTTSETTEITFADLAPNDEVDVFGANDVTDAACVLADTIQKSEPLATP